MEDIDISIIRALFNKYNTQKKRTLDLCELETLFFDVLMNLGEKDPEQRKLEIAKEGLKIFDKNKNGTIEFNEFLEIIDFLIDQKGYQIIL